MLRLIKIFVFTAIFIFIVGAIGLYAFGIMPTSLGLHSKIYYSESAAYDGYDIVESFRKNPRKGNPMFSYVQDGIGWYFSSNTNLKTFKKQPEKYKPQFGGYCTYIMSKGFTFPSDPKVFYWYKGGLYFFKDEESKALALENWKETLKNAKLHWR